MPLASYGVAGIDDLQPGDVGTSAVQSCECCAPYLLPDRHAQHHGHSQLSARHRLPLRELVEDLVAGPAHEVGVHQLREGAAAFEA